MYCTNYFENMTLEEVKDVYKSLIEKKSIKLAQLKKQIFRVGSIRLGIVLTCIALCYILWGNTLAIVGVIFASIAAFLFFLKYHNRLFRSKRYYELLVSNANNELKGIDYDFSPFDGAAELSDGNHSYSLDLDLFGNRSFFQSINRTVTDYGKKRLADTFLNTFDEKADIIKQQKAIKEIRSNPKLITYFRAIGMMTETEDLDVENLSKQFNGSKQLSGTFWRYMPYVSFVVFVSTCVLSVLGIIPFAAFALCWIVLAGFIPAKNVKQNLSLFEKKMNTLETYSELFKIIEEQKFECESLKQLQSRLQSGQSASEAIAQLKSYSDNLDQSFTVVGLLFLNPLISWATIYSLKIEKWASKHNERIPAWFESLAQFDSLISLALYAYNHPDYVYPEVSDSYVFEGKDLGHPMINRDVCVRNDVTISKRPFFLVVTGANMAGKSTYLRTVGINMILASAGAPVYASSLKFYPYRLVTNLRTSDSLNDNESYFFAELKRLKMIIDRLQAGEELFIILDEILKGTNSEDKQKGSIALMKQLVSLGGNGIIATHDLILGNLEKEYPGEVKDYRFEADITDDQLTFSYKMREGVAQNMNACFLMKKMGITGL